jgi:hypothetical protein
MSHRFCTFVLAALFLICLAGCGGGHSSTPPPGGGGPQIPAASNTPFWAQWGANPQHSGNVTVAGQSTTHQLADIVYDPFVAQEQAESGGSLVAHYQATILDGNDVYITVKTGTYTSCTPAGDWRNGTACGPNAWHTQIWNEARYVWINNVLTSAWIFASDWKPPTNGAALGGWEPVFHPVDANNFIYVPGAGGTVWKVNKNTGASSAHINPFAALGVDAANTFVTSPISADAQGNIYYNVIGLASRTLGDPWGANDATGAWLVKITPADAASVVSYATLVPNAPAANASTCAGRFTTAASLPWPPSPTAVPPTTLCGSQRPGVNVAPVFATDGTIYTVSRAHFNQRTTYLVAVNPNLTPKWAASMQNVLNDGCGVIVPIAPINDPLQPASCRTGTAQGVDPTTNAPGSGAVTDLSSSSPTVLPDGSIIYGAQTSYNGSRGHLLKYSSTGVFQGAYDFGWDSTPAVWQHGGTYSIVIKDNHYETGLYCNFNNPACVPPLPDGPYYITQLNPQLQVEWKFQSTNTQSCSRNANGTMNCVSDHPNGFEWCINMPAVDMNGTVFVNGEDGNIYSLPQGHNGVFTTPGSSMFLNLALGAAYTPLSVGPDGRLYTQNAGHLFVVGN